MTFNQKISGELSIKNLTIDAEAETEQLELRFIYEKLREEILQNDSSVLQILGFTLVIISATMGFTFKESTKDIFKVVAIAGLTGVIALSTIQTIRKLNRTYVIASYLKKFIEPKCKAIKWETHLSLYRQKVSGTLNHQQSSALISYQCISIINSLISFFYTYSQYNSIQTNTAFKTLCLSISLSVLNVIICIYILKKIRNHLVDITNKIDDNWKFLANEIFLNNVTKNSDT